jgi:hypothetical protein
MTIKRINEFQEAYGYKELQDLINSGAAWKMEGSVGRASMAALESGACYLPKVFHKDYYGNTIPSREALQEGTKGTLLNSKRFWSDSSNFID